jgi:hypothetical protein
VPSAPCRLQAIVILTLEPERLKEPIGHHQKRSPEMEGLFTPDAQAASGGAAVTYVWYPFQGGRASVRLFRCCNAHAAPASTKMVWPITLGKSCVGERGKSMKAEESALAEEDGCRKISITLIDLFGGVSAMA